MWAVVVFAVGCAAGVPEVSQGPDVQPDVAALPTVLPTAAAELLAGWETYTDPAAGYTVRYPPGVHFSAGKSRAGISTARIQFRVPGVDGYQGMLIRVEPNPEGQGVEAAASAVYRRFIAAAETGLPADWFAGLEHVTVGGLAGVQVGHEGDFSLVVPYRDRLYIIAPVHDMAMTGLDPQALALFYQVLGTLEVAP